MRWVKPASKLAEQVSIFGWASFLLDIFTELLHINVAHSGVFVF